MIPKVIHYCWFGGKPLPESAKKCIASWRKYLPDYEIKEWNESNFDVNMIPYTEEAYMLKKYAFVSDYARFWILYKYGGLYFDTDVEVVRPMEEIIERGPFMGREKKDGDEDSPYNISVNPGLGIAAPSYFSFYGEILRFYESHHFSTWSGVAQQTVVDITTKIIMKHGVEKITGNILECKGVFIYPTEYFCPMNYFTKEMKITENTISIHHYTATWCVDNRSFIEKLKKRISFIYVRLTTTLKRNVHGTR